jgi:hypothetical protein
MQSITLKKIGIKGAKWGTPIYIYTQYNNVLNILMLITEEITEEDMF